ncbi:MAG: O-antigen ligase family protein [Deltaproteobacteria bacterium]|nr:O-antigen ligase family protein [Deltaproteobacteria bacterium]
MKYMIFAMALVVGVPVMAAAAIYSERIKGWLLTLMIFATTLADRGNINFMSMETYRGPDRGFEITAIELIAMALGISLLVKKTRQIKWIPYNTFFMLLYFLVALYSIRSAPEPLLSWFTVFKLIRSWLLYWTVVNCIRTGVPMRAVWRGLIAVAALMVFEGLQQKYLGGLYRVSATFDHSNTLAMYLNMLSALMLAFGLADRSLNSWRTAVTLVAALGLLLTTVMTFSRAGMALGFVCALGVLVFTNVRTRSKRVFVATMFAFAGLVFGGAMVGPSIVDRFMEAPAASEGAREEFNKAARLMLEDNPMGVGVNQFSHVLDIHHKYRKHFKIMAGEKHAGVCHHVYWLTAAELGWPGIIAFALVLIRFAWRAFIYSWRTPGRDGALQAALFLSMVATYASGFFEWVFRITPLFFTFLILAGISVGLSEVEKQRRRTLRARSAADSVTAMPEPEAAHELDS